ncbi:MAG: hypothetical protein WA989_05115 [Henriciella sp.]|uniref:hypothetical protein n=1 Tax=Henriciella sp. TaxID=1968823 RepID=UPI003C78EC5D
MPASADFTPRAILKLACPFSLKFRIFLHEAGLADRFRFDVVEDGTEAYDEAKQTLEDAGTEASFPGVEIAPGEYLSDSDALIDHYAGKFGIDRENLPLLNYYEEGVFKLSVDLFEENQELKEEKAAA